MNEKIPLVILSGATAVGKTELSISLAKAINGEIISADSMQVYKGMDIGTAKITKEEMQGISHYMIDELDPREAFNVYIFQKKAQYYIQKIREKNKIPILTGGTGFYIQALLYDVDFNDSHIDENYRHHLEKLAQDEGPEHLHRMLEAVDPASAEAIHANNIKRVIRALEYYHETGQKISVHNQEQREKESAYRYAYFVLNRDRKILYQRIDQRVDRMLEDGLIEEVRTLLAAGVPEDALSMQGLGYKEIVSYLHRELSLDDAAALIKQNTRHFAKRQITWFKREKDVIWMDYADYPDITRMLEKILSILKEKNIVSIS